MTIPSAESGAQQPASVGSAADCRARIEVRSIPGYPVTIGRFLPDAIVAAVADAGAGTVAIVHPAPLARMAESVKALLESGGSNVHLVQVPDGEDAKSLGVLAFLWDVFGQIGLDRTDLVIGLGGGSSTDLAGFAAATWLRGVRVLQLPTTLLAMVDAAVGGKTGINSGAGKNMVGSFHEPVAVIGDLAALDTLPEPELVAGLAEIIKCGFIADPQILTLIERALTDPGLGLDAVLDPAGPLLAELVQRAVRVKAEVVAADLKEASLREILNYGHTFGHAIEKREQYRWRHGEAISVGMVFAAALAAQAGRLDPEVVNRTRRLLAAVGLPTSYPATEQARAELIELMGSDKKTRSGVLRFVILTDRPDIDSSAPAGRGTGPLRTERLAGPSEAALAAAFDAIDSDTENPAAGRHPDGSTAGAERPSS
ncbi:3-dehydroquinate synthase [Nakamurella aerolata]|uniref:3-dehydroquinate synthase n=1 Tax=Nakamurella aerolata TaxID=1656892 RepID=A0A849A9V9_9ACTN|nr:3-dehydroquinate synthase [Nakamurella aerolata]NNG37319.1 3-dehydroquinate synthase [Nakamurella aerolata]